MSDCLQIPDLFSVVVSHLTIIDYAASIARVCNLFNRFIKQPRNVKIVQQILSPYSILPSIHTENIHQIYIIVQDHFSYPIQLFDQQLMQTDYIEQLDTKALSIYTKHMFRNQAMITKEIQYCGDATTKRDWLRILERKGRETHRMLMRQSDIIMQMVCANGLRLIKETGCFFLSSCYQFKKILSEEELQTTTREAIQDKIKQIRKVQKLHNWMVAILDDALPDN